MIVRILNKNKEIDIEIKRISLNIPEKGVMKLTTKDNKEIIISASDFVDIVCVGERVMGEI